MFLKLCYFWEGEGEDGKRKISFRPRIMLAKLLSSWGGGDSNFRRRQLKQNTNARRRGEHEISVFFFSKIMENFSNFFHFGNFENVRFGKIFRHFPEIGYKS